MQDGQTHTRKSTGYCVHCTIKQMTVSSNLHMWTSTFLFLISKYIHLRQKYQSKNIELFKFTFDFRSLINCQLVNYDHTLNVKCLSCTGCFFLNDNF